MRHARAEWGTGATVTLIDEAKGTKTTRPRDDRPIRELRLSERTQQGRRPTRSKSRMDGFTTSQRKGIPVSGGDRVTVRRSLTLIKHGGTTETVTVVAESPMIQAKSGERSFTVSTEPVENLPIQHRSFTAARLAPGVTRAVPTRPARASAARATTTS